MEEINKFFFVILYSRACYLHLATSPVTVTLSVGRFPLLLLSLQKAIYQKINLFNFCIYKTISLPINELIFCFIADYNNFE